MQTYSKVMISVWVGMAVASLIFTAYKIGETSFSESIIYISFSVVASVMAALRYYTHKRLKKYKENNE